jgi:hypothetical protein
MITRRQFLKTTGLLGLSLAPPLGILKQEATAAALSNIYFTAPAVMTQIINLGNLDVPLNLRPTALDSNFQNSYERSKNGYLDSGDDKINSDKIDSLAQSLSSSASNKFNKVNEAFLKREELAAFIAASFNSDDIAADLPVDPDTSEQIQYPNSFRLH